MDATTYDTDFPALPGRNTTPVKPSVAELEAHMAALKMENDRLSTELTIAGLQGQLLAKESENERLIAELHSERRGRAIPDLFATRKGKDLRAAHVTIGVLEGENMRMRAENGAIWQHVSRSQAEVVEHLKQVNHLLASRDQEIEALKASRVLLHEKLLLFKEEGDGLAQKKGELEESFEVVLAKCLEFKELSEMLEKKVEGLERENGELKGEQEAEMTHALGCCVQSARRA